MLKSVLCDYSDAYVLVEGSIIFLWPVAVAAARNNKEENFIEEHFKQYTGR